MIERGIVAQIADDVKTPESRRSLHIDRALLDTLKLWKQTTQFSATEDWLFASPAHLGRLPWSYDQAWRMYQKAGAKAGIGRLGTHSLRHTYRSWLDAVGTPLAVQQKLMRHADIRTTTDIYRDIVTDEMALASGKVTQLRVSWLCQEQFSLEGERTTRSILNTFEKGRIGRAAYLNAG